MAIVTKQLMLQACPDGERTRPANLQVKIDIADVCGAIASAVVRAAHCREYLRLIRTGDGRKITNVLGRLR